MKTLKLIGMALIAVIMCVNFAACSDDDSNDNGGGKEAVITPSGNSQNFFDKGINFTSDTGSELIEFTTNMDWTLSVANTAGGEIWCTVSANNGKAGDNAITVKALENTGYDDRSVTLTIKAGNIKKTIIVTQKQKGAILLTSDKFEVDKTGGKIEIEVKSNINYTVEVAENAKDWIKKATTNTRALVANTLMFEISPSEEYDKRSGEIYFKSGEMTETVYVYQAGGGTVLLTKDEYPVSDKGETIKVELKSNCDYGVKMPDVDWIKSAPATKAMSSHTLYFIVSPNETCDNREAKIIFYDKKNAVATADTLTVIQMQKDAIILSQNSYEVDADGGNFDVELKANIDYTVTIPNESAWIKQVTTRGLVKNTLHFTVDKMTVNKDREGTIIIEGTDSSLKSTITVKQKKKDMGTLTLHVEKAGTLRDLIGNENLHEVKNLTLIGELNGSDISFIREMAREYYNDNGLVETNLSTLNLSDAKIVEGGTSYYKYLMTYFYTRNNLISQYMFIDCVRLTSVILPKDITAIEAHAFDGCTNLVSVKFSGNSVTSIGDWAFYECKKMVSFEIPNGVTSIGKFAFEDCESLPSITLNNVMTEIRESAFSGCKSLTFLEIPDNIMNIEFGAFAGCSELATIIIGKNVKNIKGSAFSGCKKLKEIHCKPTTSPRVEDSSFPSSYFLPSVTLYVPLGCTDTYSFWMWEHKFCNKIVEE